MATVSLQLIVKDETDKVMKLIDDAYDYFDQINVTISDKPCANKIKKHYMLMDVDQKLQTRWREWNDNFADARNANYALSTTDYTFWLDADDEFDFKAIPQLVEIAEENDIDAIFLPYNYAQDEEGNCVARHWRERLVRANKGFEWRGWVHETYITDQEHTNHRVDFEVLHRSTNIMGSVERNHKILEKAYAETKDPRYTHYLGMSYFSHGEYEKAIDILCEYLEVGGSLEDTYRSLAIISECAYHLKQYDLAMEYASKCIGLKPKYPMGYYLFAQYEADQENWEEALEWCNVALSKPDPDTLAVYDPSARERCILIAAQADFMLGNYRKAHNWLKRIPNNPTAKTLMDDFAEDAAKEQFIELLPKLRSFFNSDADLWQSLSHDIRFDSAVRELRNAATKPITWDNKSLVIFCGQGYEEWGPNTLDKGMGGSEEAAVYLSRELAKLGWHVTVYGEVDYEESFEGPGGDFYTVTWLPWKEIDIRDTFNVFISWRYPQYLEKITAKVKIADIHDVMPGEIMKNLPNQTYFVKSKFHRELYPEVPDERFKIIGNGIKKDQF